MDLDDWRSRINNLDAEILNLLNQRAEAALQIGHLKRRQGMPSYVPEREAEILRLLSAQNRGPLTADNLVAIWRELLSACRALEGPLRIVSCMSEKDDCPQFSRCNLRGPVQKIQASISQVLDGMTLAELAADPVIPVGELAVAR